MIHKSNFRVSGFTRRELYVFYGVSLVVFITGVVWLYFDNFVILQTAFGQSKHPAQKWLMQGHGLAAIGFTFLLGLVYGVHIKRVWPMRRRRFSGLSLAALIVILCLSGFLLYYLSHEWARYWSAILHWSVGLVVPVVLIRHIFKINDDRR